MIRILFPILAGLLLGAPWATAQEGPLKVALSGNYLPLHGTSKAGMYGFEADLAKELGKALGRQVEFVNTRKAFKLGTIDAVAQGKVDLGLNSITPTAERAQKVDFTKPYIELAYRLAGKDPELDGAIDQMAVKVAAPSAMVSEAVAKAMPKATIIDCKGMGKCIQMVLDDQAKFVAYEDVGLHNAVASAPLAVYPHGFGASPLAIATPKGKVGPVDAALAKLGPSLKQLKAKWKPGQNHLPNGEAALLDGLPATMMGLVKRQGRLMRPSYCYAEPPAINFAHKKDGSWEVWQALGQDSHTGKIQRARREGRKVRIKVMMGSYGPNYPMVMVLERKARDHWICDKCHPAAKDFVPQAFMQNYSVHDYDADSRDENGECGPP